jgi:hypothetical protein
MVEFPKYPICSKILLELMTGNVIISEVDPVLCVVLSKAEKHEPYGKLVGTTECVTLQTRCCTNRGPYNRI